MPATMRVGRPTKPRRSTRPASTPRPRRPPRRAWPASDSTEPSESSGGRPRTRGPVVRPSELHGFPIVEEKKRGLIDDAPAPHRLLQTGRLRELSRVRPAVPLRHDERLVVVVVTAGDAAGA